MTDLRLEPIGDDTGIPGAPGGPSLEPVNPARENLLAGLRAKAAALDADRTRVFDLPKYGGLLVARYRRLPWAEIQKLRGAAQVDVADYSAGFLVAACVEVLIRDEDGTLVRPVSAYEMTFTRELLDLVGRPARDSARENLKSLFADEDLLWISHAMDVGEWMTSPDAEPERLGE